MIFKDISKCPVLKDIEEQKLEQVFGQIHYNVKSYNKDSLVATAGETCDSLMILIKGRVRAEMADFSGNAIKIAEISAPRPIAPAFLFGDKNRYPVTTITEEETRILVIPREEVLKLFQLNKTILENYLDIVSSRSQFLSDKVKLLSFKTLKERIAYYLLEQKDQPKKTEKTTQQEMARYLGVTRPALARTLGQMEEDGIIAYRQGVIEILDEGKLSGILG